MEAASPPQRPASAMPPLAWLLLALSAAVTAVWFVHALGYWEDDAYIHLEFARSVATGHGFAFNGRTVYGDTSPLWVYLLVAAHAIVPGWMVAGKTLTAVAAVVALSGAYVFARSLVRTALPAANASVFAAAMLLVFVLNPYFGYWAFSGMEALLAAGVACWGGFAIAPRQLSSSRFLLGCFLAGLAPVLRPEMSFFTVLMGLILIERLVRMAAPAGRKLALLIAGLVLTAAPAIAWARYALHTFGMVVPNTNAAKRASPGDSVPKHLLSVYGGGFPVVLLGLVLLAAWLVWFLLRSPAQRHASPAQRNANPAQRNANPAQRNANPAQRNASPAEQRPGLARALHAGGWLLFVWTAINCVFYIADHTYVQTRYIFVTAPVLTIAIFAIAATRFPRVYRPLLGFALAFGIFTSVLATWPLVSAKKQLDLQYAELAAYLKQLPPEAGVAYYSIGEATFLSGHTIIDTGGITRPSFIPLMADATDDRRMAWIYDQGGQYEVMDHQPLPGAVLVWSQRLPSTRWKLHLHRDTDFDMLLLWKLPPRR